MNSTLSRSGEKCLPIILVDGAIIAEGAYPSREELAVLVSVATTSEGSLYSLAVEELVAIGAAIGANCESCLEYHFREARKAGVGRDDIALAVSTARKVKEAAAGKIVQLAGRQLAAAAAGRNAQSGPLLHAGGRDFGGEVLLMSLLGTSPFRCHPGSSNCLAK